MRTLFLTAFFVFALWWVRESAVVPPRGCFSPSKNVGSRAWRVGWDDGCGAVVVAALRDEIRRTGEQCAPAIAVGAPFQIVVFNNKNVMVNPRIVRGSSSTMSVRYESARGVGSKKRIATIHDAWVEVEYARGDEMMELDVRNVTSGGDAECLQVAMADF